jgi:hypothetical protein
MTNRIPRLEKLEKKLADASREIKENAKEDIKKILDQNPLDKIKPNKNPYLSMVIGGISTTASMVIARGFLPELYRNLSSPGVKELSDYYGVATVTGITLALAAYGVVNLVSAFRNMGGK